MNNEAPIALFDSGVGGLSVLRALRQVLPFENVIYFADNKRVPYGDKSSEDIAQYVLKTGLFLEKLGAKMIVIACHTGSIHGLKVLQNALSIPVIGIIESSIRVLKRIPQNKKTAILGTKSTIESNVYQKYVEIAIPCPFLVPLIEKGVYEGIDLEQAIASIRLDSLSVKALFLACTHYPLILNSMKKVLGNSLSIFDPAEEISEEIYSALKEKGLLRTYQESPLYRFFASKDLDAVYSWARFIFGDQICEKADFLIGST